LRYTVSFISTKINALDNANQADDMDETTEPPPSLETTNTPITHIYLGSIKKEMTVADFAGDSAGNGLTYSIFRRMLEDFLNKFYAAHELPRERYLKVQGDQKVTSESYS